jgi:hypothetical protein
VVDRITHSKGEYAKDDQTYKVVFPRSEATIVQDYQSLSPSLGLNSWATFGEAMHHDAILSAQYLLLPDEVNPVLTAILESGLDVTGLAPSCLFEGHCLYTLDVTGEGTLEGLAGCFRRGLDEIDRTRRRLAFTTVGSTRPAVPVDSAIDGGQLDAILSMRGNVVGGAYKAAIGKRSVLHGKLIGREMGASTWVSVAGTNDHALAQGEFVESPEDLQRVLKAMRARDVNIECIRNHMVTEHPQLVFIRFWAEGRATELAKSIRYVLDVDFNITPSAQAKR